MSVLVDTSVWVDFFRRGPAMAALDTLLGDEEAATHPLVVAELACGSPPNPRHRTLLDIESLPQVRIATLDEARSLLEREKLYGRGLGVVDLMLLASTLITPGARLFTLDKRLLEVANQFAVGHAVAKH
jgi:predicted nucleic acid-binding protein